MDKVFMAEVKYLYLDTEHSYTKLFKTKERAIEYAHHHAKVMQWKDIDVKEDDDIDSYHVLGWKEGHLLDVFITEESIN